jgi:hypothetical protein
VPESRVTKPQGLENVVHQRMMEPKIVSNPDDPTRCNSDWSVQIVNAGLIAARETPHLTSNNR